MKVDGKALMLRLDGKTIALSTDCAADFVLELFDAKTKDDVGACDVAGDITGTLSTSALVGVNDGKYQQTFATLMTLFLTRQEVEFEMMLAANYRDELRGSDWAPGADTIQGFARVGGKVKITALQLSGKVAGKASYSAQMKLQGHLVPLDGVGLTVSVEGNVLVISGNVTVLDLDYYSNLAVTDGTLNFEKDEY